MSDILAPIHPGEILLEDYLKPMNVTPHRLAILIGVDAARVHQIVKGNRRLSADTALRLSKLFGTSSQFWMNAQAAHDLQIAEIESADALARITPFAA